MITARTMRPSMRVRMGRLPLPTGRSRVAFQVRFQTSSHPSLPKREDAIPTRKVVINALLALGALGLGLYTLRNNTHNESRVTRGAAHNTEHHDSRHAHQQNNAVDLSDSEAKISSSDAPISLASSYGSPHDVEEATKELRFAFPGPNCVQTNKDALELYGSSENSYHSSSPHSVIVQVKTTEDVVKVVNISRKYRIPLVPYSGATSLEGHFSGVSPLPGLYCN